MQRMVKRSLGAMFAVVVLLAGCSSNPNAIEPNPLPEFTSEFKVKTLWSRQVGKGVKKQALQLLPAITHRGVYAADYEGLVTGFAPDTGKRLWRVKTRDRISGGLYAGYGLVMYGTREGAAVALSEEDGSVVWRVELGSEVLAPPAVDASIAVFQSIDGRVFALDTLSGGERWTFDNPVPTLILRGSATPTIVDDRVYVAFANGKVAALEHGTGTPLWERRAAEPTGRSELERLVDISNNLIVEGGGLFVASFQGSVSVLDEDSGRPYWSKDMSTATRMSSEHGVLYIADHTGHVWAIDQRSGDTLWKQDALYGRNLVGVALQRGQVVTGDAEGYLHWMDTETGHITARTRLHRKGFAAAPVSRDDVLYAFGRRGKLVAYTLTPRS